MPEIWKDIKWFEWKYKISNLWNVKWKKWLRKLCLVKLWYYRVTLYKEDLQKSILVHRLVAEAFLSNPENKPQVNHINWIKDDNRVENLEWCTNQENQKHSFEKLWRKWTWKWKFWKDNPSSKKVDQFTKDWEFIKSFVSIYEASKKLKISSSNICNCCLWKRKTAWWFIFKY